MLTETPQPLALLTERALRLLLAELGPIDTVRFLSQYTLGEGDAVADKDRLVGSLTVAEIAAAIRQAQMAAGAPACAPETDDAV
jgi:hypothetical protein